MSRIVPDASATIGWLLEDEQDARSLSAFSRAQREGAVVPQHWRFEVANALLVAERSGRLRPGGAATHLNSLRALSIQTDDSTDLDETLSLAFEYDLSFYDAVYLERALRRGLPLATLDGDLMRAVPRAGVDLFRP